MTIADTATQSPTQDATYTLRPEELRALTTEAIDLALELLRGCGDEDITFIPNDPHAHDDAAGEGEASIAWTLGTSSRT